MYLVLAQLGKRVLRPGGIGVTTRLLDAVAIGADDTVVELAPGVGATALRIMARGPRSYTAVDRDPSLARRATGAISDIGGRVVVAPASDSGLPDGSASVVVCEAMLSMQSTTHKRAIVTEVARVLRSGGRFGLHELAFVGADAQRQRELEDEYTRVVRAGVRVCTVDEWRGLLAEVGLEVELVELSNWRLLTPGAVIRDEGVRGATRFGWALAKNRVARGRITALRRLARSRRDEVRVALIVGRKPS
jgi:SAM-dependent methyltransferase